VDHPVCQVQLDPRAILARKGTLVRKAIRVHQVQRGHREIQELQAYVVAPDSMVPLELPEQQVHKDNKVILVRLDLPEEQPVLKVQQGQSDPLE